MSLALAVAVGGLFAVGTFLLLQRDLVRVVLGVAVVSQATFVVYLIAMGASMRVPRTSCPFSRSTVGKFPRSPIRWYRRSS